MLSRVDASPGLAAEGLEVRVQTGEPNFNTLKALDYKEAARVKPFVFKFES
jgi:hypothetical protein